MEICKSHKECFTKICSLCEDYEPLSSDAVLADGWREVSKALPDRIKTDNIWEKDMTDEVLIYMQGRRLIARYHYATDKWVIPGFTGDWRPTHWQPIPLPPTA